MVQQMMDCQWELGTSRSRDPRLLFLPSLHRAWRSETRFRPASVRASKPCCGVGKRPKRSITFLCCSANSTTPGNADPGKEFDRLGLQRPIFGMHEGHVEKCAARADAAPDPDCGRWRPATTPARWHRWRRLPASGGTCCGKIGRTRSRRRHGRRPSRSAASGGVAFRSCRRSPNRSQIRSSSSGLPANQSSGCKLFEPEI